MIYTEYNSYPYITVLFKNNSKQIIGWCPTEAEMLLIISLFENKQDGYYFYDVYKSYKKSLPIMNNYTKLSFV